MFEWLPSHLHEVLQPNSSVYIIQIIRALLSLITLNSLNRLYGFIFKMEADVKSVNVHAHANINTV